MFNKINKHMLSLIGLIFILLGIIDFIKNGFSIDIIINILNGVVFILSDLTLINKKKAYLNTSAQFVLIGVLTGVVLFQVLR